MVSGEGKPYTPIPQPTSIKAIILKYEGKTYKFAEYFDDPSIWTTPNIQNAFEIYDKIKDEDNNVTLNKIVRQKYSIPKPSVYEMYNLTDDPLEIKNLSFWSNSTEKTRKLEEYFKVVLEVQCNQKLLTPTLKVTPDVPIFLTPIESVDEFPYPKFNVG